MNDSSQVIKLPIKDCLYVPNVPRLAVDINNSTPTKSGLLPEEIYTGQKGKNKLELFHMFGCPVFVLEP